MGPGPALVLWGLVSVIGAAKVDWTAGFLQVEAGAAPSLRAPSPQIARVAAERAARQSARTKLIEAVRQLPVAGGGTVGRKLERESHARKRIEEALGEPEVAWIRYASDGGIELGLRVPLDVIAQALAEAKVGGATRPTQEPAEAAAPRIVTLGGKHEPAIVPGAALRFYDSLDEARKDTRLGDSPEIVHVTKLTAPKLRGGPVAVVLSGAP